MVALSAVSSVTAHGYLSSPPPRGIEKESTNVDALKAPNFSGNLCRGEPAGKVSNVGHSVTLGFTITAPHIGMCEVYILDENLSNPRKIAEKLDCAASGKVGPWTVNIPGDVSGRKVLRWVWNAAHLGTTIEPYEQCVDINVSG
jgi:predicted carbohydrate-binding protein with CBM5 and CBM33 domain